MGGVSIFSPYCKPSPFIEIFLRGCLKTHRPPVYIVSFCRCCPGWGIRCGITSWPCYWRCFCCLRCLFVSLCWAAWCVFVIMCMSNNVHKCWYVCDYVCFKKKVCMYIDVFAHAYVFVDGYWSPGCWVNSWLPLPTDCVFVSSWLCFFSILIFRFCVCE